MSIFKSAQEAQFTFKINGTEFSVLEFIAEERLSSLFDVRLKVASKKRIKFDQVIGRVGILEIDGQDEMRYFNGIIGTFHQTDTVGRFFLYSMDLVPSMWLLSLRKDIRIFQKKSVPDIIKAVLNDAGITSNRFDFRLKGAFEERYYCVQYRETDLQFITRLMAEEGIFFFFEHDKHDHLLVFGNTDMNYMPIKGDKMLLFNSKTSLIPEKEYVSSFHLSHTIFSGKVTLKDFNFERPSLDLTSEGTSKEYDKYEVYDYPGKYQNTEKGKKLSEARRDEKIQFCEKGSGKSISPRFTPGFLFTLNEHPNDEMNKGYLIVSVIHKGSQTQALEEQSTTSGKTSYENEFTVIPDTTVFRPSTDIKKPTVEGIQTAIVTGPKGEEIYVDKHGRVKVQFHWDRLGKKDEKSSCWIRVSQVWAGKGWGALFIPRIGQEVVVDFVNGDPDRPLITGRVYHGTNTPPYNLPEERTKSTIKSNSSPDGKGFNEIRMEDQKGKEELFIHGEKDWNIFIKNDKAQSIGHDESLTVENDRTKAVKKNQKETIGENKTIDVSKDHTETIGKNESISVTENSDRSVGKNSTLRVEKNANNSIGESLTLDVGKNYTCSVKETAQISIGDECKSQVTGNMTLFTKQKALIDAQDQLTLRCGDANIILKSNGDIQINGQKLNLKASGELKLKGSKITGN